METFKQLKEFYWNEKRFLIGSILALAMATALGLVYPNLLRILIDDVILEEKFELVLRLAIILVVVVVIKGGLQYLHGWLGGFLGNKVAFSIRNSLYKKLQYLSFQYYDTAKTGDLMSRLTADLEAVRQFIGFGFAQILNMFFMITFGSVMMLTINWKLTLITMATMPFLVFVAFRFEGKIHPAFRQIRRSMANLTTAVQENVTGVRTVKSFARENYEVEKFSIQSEDYKTNHIETSFIWARYFPVMELIANLSVVFLILAGGYFVIEGTMTPGELIMFYTLIWYIIGPLWGLGFQINNYTQSKASGERIIEILHQYQHVKDRDGAVDLNPAEVRGSVKFEHVSFRYNSKSTAIEDFSLDAPAGSVIGLLGGTGSGKSTIIQLLMRAYNVREGTITVDGHDIRDLTISSLRSQIGVVFQETFLFSSTIRNNIAYGLDEISDEDIIAAAKRANAHDFIMEMPDGYDTVIGERGMGLSGGQRQRIAIARALILNPKILILDDATSAVDMETEHEIQAALKEVMEGRTTFIIAHRISSLRHADEIVVLDGGKVVQRGTHRTLLAEPGPYLDTFNIQYSDQPVNESTSTVEEREVAK